MKVLTIEVDDSKEVALKTVLTNLGIHFSESSVSGEISEPHKKHILDIQKKAREVDFKSWAEMRSNIKA